MHRSAVYVNRNLFTESCTVFTPRHPTSHMETEKDEEEAINPIEQMRISVRSASFGVLLLIFGGTKMPFVSEQIAKFSQRDETCKEICEGPFCFDLCDHFHQALTAYSVMDAGLAFIILFSIIGIVQSVNPQVKCGKKKSIFGIIK